MDFDVLIIGSGAGGGMTALRLCQRGFKVGLIERGKRFDPRSDYILNHSNWDTRSDPLKAAENQEQTIDRSYRTPVMISGRKRYREALNYHRVYGLGGSTLHYQGEAHRFGEHVFAQKTTLGWGLDWPVSYAELAPYYQQSEKILSVAGNQGNPYKPAREAFPCPAHPLSPISQILKQSASEIGLSVQHNTLALPTKSIDGRTPCQGSGGCNFGCIFNAKSSVDQAVIPKAEATGNLVILAETRALRFMFNDSGQIKSVLCVKSANELELSAKTYVLAGGAVETPRLMLASTHSQHQRGFANEYDQVGRYFMETIVARLSMGIGERVKTYLGPPLDSRIWDFYKPQDKITNGFVLGSAGYLYPAVGPVNHAKKIPGIGRSHKETVRSSFGRNLELFGIAEQQPIFSNRIILSKNKDNRGVLKVKVHSQYSKQDINTLGKMHVQLNAWAKATPNSSIRSTSDTRLRSSATHVAGTCRMGNEPERSVVDAYGKIHGQTNCYITDGSVMPNQGAGDSPSLTIQALALRTADKIADEMQS